MKFQLEMHVFDIHKWVLGTWITSTLLLLRSASWAQLTAALKKPVLYSSAPPKERQSLPMPFFVNEWRWWPPVRTLLKLIGTERKKFRLGFFENQCVHFTVWTLVIQVRNSKNLLNMEALSIGCRNKHRSLIILSNFDFIDWLSLNMPGCCGTGCFWVQSSLHHNG